MDILTYLDRLNYRGQVKPDLITLRGLHLAHMLSIPFENLDIGINRPIRIDRESIWNKLIINRRGGFCYELNGAFAWLLQQIGFRVTYLNGRVFNKEGDLGIGFDHLALMVQLHTSPTRWLADVGFGDSFTEPLSLDELGEQAQGLRAYRLEWIPEGYVVWQRNYDGVWKRQYLFDLQPRTFPDEYEAACRYHQTSPHSTFTRGSIISKATRQGRISLEDGWLIVTEDGRRTEQQLNDRQEYHSLLKKHFNISLQEESL